MLVASWHPPRPLKPNIVPMVWGWIIDGHVTPERLAFNTIPGLRAAPPGERVLIFNGPGGVFNGIMGLPFDQQDAKVTPYVDYFKKYFSLLARADAIPDRICTDEERPVSANVLARVFVGPPRSAFDRDIPYSNYGNAGLAFTVVDNNGKSFIPPGSTISTVSSPPLYQWGWGARYGKCSKDLLWNQLIDNLNWGRSIVATGATFTPWLSYPTFSGLKRTAELDRANRWSWRLMVLHLRRAGMDGIYYWNPNNETHPADDGFASEIFFEAENWQPARSILPPIPTDADSITTAGFTTTYPDFLAGSKRA